MFLYLLENHGKLQIKCTELLAEFLFLAQWELSAHPESLLLGDLQKLQESLCHFCHVRHFLGSIQVSLTSPPQTLPSGWFWLALSQMEGMGHFSGSLHHAEQGLGLGSTFPI